MRVPAAFDSVVMAAVIRELQPWTGARVQRVVQPAPLEVALELRSRRAATTLLLSAHARWARVHLAPPAAPEEPAPFVQMLRARLDHAQLLAADQPPFERSLTLRFGTDGGEPALVAEIMGRHSNLILVQDGVVTGALKLIGPAQSSVREVLPGRPFTPPPSGRPTPAELDAARLAALLQEAEGPLAPALTAQVLGLSPAMARELAVRAGLDPDGPASAQSGGAARLSRALADLVTVVRDGAFHPIVYLEGASAVGYAPFPFGHLRHLAQIPAATMSEAVARVTGRLSRAAAVEDARAALQTVVRAALARAARAEGDLAQALRQAEDGGTLRTQGELLLAYASQIAPGSAEATLPGFDGAPVTVPLDPTLTAVENAQRLFARYAKVRAARPQLLARAGVLEDDRRYLESVLAMLLAASGSDDLAALRGELSAEGYLRRGARRRPAAVARPRAFVLDGGATLLVGRSNQDNDHITFKVAAPGDLWFHARGVPGAHVLLRTGGRAPTDAERTAAAAAAAYYSGARAAGAVAVDYTERRYVRKPRGSRPGAVVYERERTVRVAPRAPAG